MGKPVYDFMSLCRGIIEIVLEDLAGDTCIRPSLLDVERAMAFVLSDYGELICDYGGLNYNKVLKMAKQLYEKRSPGSG
jgi:hypothetical protein